MTIAAMKQALECLDDDNDAFTAAQILRAAIAEQEQCDPVAWQHRQRGPAEENWQEWRTVGHTPQGPESRTFQMRPLFAHPAPIPAGWQLVPVEPTKAMLSAGWGNDHLYADLYKAMLQAAPKEPGL